MPVASPNSKPRLHSAEVLEIINHYKVDLVKYPLVVVGIRGYYLNSLGVAGKNDRGIYDDAVFLYTENVCASFNANTDPSVVKPKIAVLQEGVWYSYRFDTHRGSKTAYPAICQRAGVVTVMRDGDPPYLDTGMFGINIHQGYLNSTSSLGCTTIYPTQYDGFYKLAESEAKRLWGEKWKDEVVPYCLISEENRRLIKK